jgi:DNA polymerase III subunit alpha
MEFVHLQVRSEYSLLEGACRISQLVEKAQNLRFKALAITDKNVMYGVIPFYKACQRVGIKPIIGMELNIDGFHLVLLAKNNLGYKHLLKASTYINSGEKKSYDELEQFMTEHSEGLIAISPGVQGELEGYLQNGQDLEAKQFVEKRKKMFNGHFYLSIQHHNLRGEEYLNERLFELGKTFDVKCVVTNNVLYLNEEDAAAYECLLCIKDGEKLSDKAKNGRPPSSFYLKSSSELFEVSSKYIIELKHSVDIANECNVEIKFENDVLPKFPLKEGQDSERMLRNLCAYGLKQRYQQPSNEVLERLNYELEIINKMNFNDYFLIVADFMKYAHEQRILTGPGRGSAAGSLVAYVLFITDVDPIEHDLLFERFLNPERISMPDIDIDFEDTKRDKVIQYVANKYGHDHVAQIITFGTLSARAVIRDVGRVLAIDLKQVDRLAKLIPSRVGITLLDAIQESEQIKELVNASNDLKKVYKIAKRLEGLPRHSSTHAAGVVISRDSLENIVPLQNGQSGMYLTQFEMDTLAQIGLLKMDFLGLRNLTILQRTKKMIEQHERVSINLRRLPLQDEQTFKLLGSGNTTGVFQLESSGMRRVLRNLKPTKFEDIVAVNALYRPGPMEQIPLYIDVKHGRIDASYPHPDLVPILEETYGVIVYQEQIMKVASKLAGFSLGQSDVLRRAVSKKDKDELQTQRKQFVEGSIRNGYDEKTANDVYDLIVKFANYGFNRSHAVAYSMIAYQLAYLKANYPTMFFAALLSSAIGNDDKIAQYIGEAKAMELKIHPPSINESTIQFKIYEGGILFSLAAIKNVGIAAIRAITAERVKKPFTDFYDFCARVPLKLVNRKALEALICAGCFDEFSQHRASLLASIDAGIHFGELLHTSKDHNQLGLFEDEALQMKPKFIDVPPFLIQDQLQLEKDAIGFYLSGHPILAYDALLKDYEVIKIGFVEASQKNLKQKIAGLITSSKVIRTKKGEQMSFVTLSDDTGDIDVVVFPKLYNRDPSLFSKGNLLLIEGKLEDDDGKNKCIANDAQQLQEVSQRLYIKIHERSIESMERLKTIIKSYRGLVPIMMYYEQEKKTMKLGTQFNIDASERCIQQLKNVFGDKNVVLTNK